VQKFFDDAAPSMHCQQEHIVKWVSAFVAQFEQGRQ
jgi:hypothetical protein